MTLQTDGRIDGGYHNIPAFSLKSAGIIIPALLEEKAGIL